MTIFGYALLESGPIVVIRICWLLPVLRRTAIVKLLLKRLHFPPDSLERNIVMTLSLGLLLLRLVAGLTLAAHGAQKLFGWFEGPGFTRLVQGFTKQGFKPVWLWACLVILGELGGGLSLALGFLTPLGAAGIFGAMFMAIAKSHWKYGFWASKRGFEYPLSLLTIGVAIGLMGPGGYSLDTLLGMALPEAPLFGTLAVAALLVDVMGLLISREPATIASREAMSRPS